VKPLPGDGRYLISIFRNFKGALGVETGFSMDVKFNNNNHVSSYVTF
jgi:hypothetical protein